jgi:hypothetical protein
MKAYVGALVATLALPASADVLVSWDFNSDDGSVSTGTLSPSAGSGTLMLVGGATSFFGSGSPNDPAAFPLNSAWSVGGFPAQGTASGTAGFVGSFSTVGYQPGIVQFDFKNQPSSNKWYSFETSVDGGLTWFSAQQFAVLTTDTWQTVGFQTPWLYNLPNAVFKVTAIYAPGTTQYEATEAGYNGDFGLQIDRLEVLAAPVPEPSTYALLVAGLLGGAYFARRRS